MRPGLQGREVLRAPPRVRLRQLGGDVGLNKGANVFEREKWQVQVWTHSVWGPWASYVTLPAVTYIWLILQTKGASHVLWVKSIYPSLEMKCPRLRIPLLPGVLRDDVAMESWVTASGTAQALWLPVEVWSYYSAPWEDSRVHGSLLVCGHSPSAFSQWCVLSASPSWKPFLQHWLHIS